jgi:uncharacterized protein YlzI (FlbEa/FlbD family)/bacterioferritin-associated ferredoxin
VDKTIEGVVMNNIAKLSNVKYSEKFDEHRRANVPIDSPSLLHSVVWELATRNPQWVFYVNAGIKTGRDIFKAEAFDVKLDDEIIGSLHHVYYRGDYCVGVSNQRIGKMMDHGTMTRTKDISKALQVARKHFSKRNQTEVVDEAHKQAKDYLANVNFTHDRKLRDAKEPFDVLAKEFAYEAGMDVFKAYLNTKVNGGQLLHNLEQMFNIWAEKHIVEQVQKQFRAGMACVVVLNGGTYIVRNQANEVISRYTDEDLPEFMRMRIGLLKLVREGQVVNNVGFRASDTTFIVLTNREETC